MHPAIEQMLSRYPLREKHDLENALKEIIQEVALLGLYRLKFFEHCAFYGGSALRILYKLDRFSEDLDFTLLEANHNFDIDYYLPGLKNELESFGLQVTIQKKEKHLQTAVQSAFIKANTHISDIQIKMDPNKLLKIKFEVDTDPLQYYQDESQLILQPIPFYVRTLCLSDLFAGKIHAVLCRSWQIRVKGRDWYDLIWFIKKQVAPNMQYLAHRLAQNKTRPFPIPKDIPELKTLLLQKIEQLDIAAAKEDMRRFIANPQELDIWSKVFFRDIVDRL